MVITGRTRNAFAFTGTRVRIPPSPPQNGSQYWLPLIKSAFATNTYNKKQTTVWDALSVFYKCDSDLGALDCKFTV